MQPAKQSANRKNLLTIQISHLEFRLQTNGLLQRIIIHCKSLKLLWIKQMWLLFKFMEKSVIKFKKELIIEGNICKLNKHKIIYCYITLQITELK